VQAKRAAPPGGAAHPGQQPQLRQVHGLQRQPPDLQVQAGFAFSVLVMVFLPGFALRRITL
jgi:hypothetical protein